MRYVSSKEFAELNSITVQRVRELLAERRIPGVIRTGRVLLIPVDAPLPAYGDLTKYDYSEGEYLALGDFAARNHTSKKRLHAMYEAGDLPEAIEAGGRLFIPASYVMPEDNRIIHGRYVGWRDKHKKL